MIIFNSVTKNGIKDFSLYISSGEMVCINDKDSKTISLLFNLISGEEMPDSGAIRFLSKGSYSTKIPENTVAFVFKKNILLANRSLEENLKYIMRVKELDMRDCSVRIRRILDIVDLKYCSSKKPADLLKHQLIRANIAQAIINYPPILVLEDILLGLDEVNSQGIIHLLKRLNKFSMTIVLLSSSSKIVVGKEVRKIKLLDMYSEKKEGFYA